MSRRAWFFYAVTVAALILSNAMNCRLRHALEECLGKDVWVEPGEGREELVVPELRVPAVCSVGRRGGLLRCVRVTLRDRAGINGQCPLVFEPTCWRAPE